MSLLNKASLIQIPSGYKDGTLYSAKPTNGDGDFTFSRGSNLAATRVNSEGLIEKGRENLLLQSNSFDTTWTTNVGVFTSGQSGYDGTNDAWKFQSNGGNTTFLLQSISESGVNTTSIYAKAGNINYIRFGFNPSSESYGFFDLTGDGAVVSELNSPIDAKIERVGTSDWYRCSITNDVSASGIVLYLSPDGTGLNVADGDFIYIQDAQLEQGLVATDYIETTTTTEQAGILEDMPRLDYSGGATCPSLLLEPQRSNLVTQSEYFGGSEWTENNTTITANAENSPEGYENSSLIVPADETDGFLLFSGINYTSGTTYTFSVFGKKENFDYLLLAFPSAAFPTNNRVALFNLNNGTIASATQSGTGAKITDYGNGWYRCSITIAATATTTSSVVFAARSTNVLTSEGNGTDGVYTYGAMLEIGSYPTSYIPTYGSSVTRVDEYKNITGNLLSKGIFGSTWTFLYDNTFVDVPRDAACALVLFQDAGGSNNVRISLNADGSYRLQDSENGVVANVDGNKILCRFNGSTIDWYVDGSEVASDSVTASNFQSIAVDNRSAFTAKPVKINKEIVFPTALTDAECIELTTI